MKRNNKSGVRCPEALIGVNGSDQPHLGAAYPAHGPGALFKFSSGALAYL